MSDNPYQSPGSTTASVAGSRPLHWKILRRVAMYQKGVLICIILYLAAIGSQFLLPEHWIAFLPPMVLADILIGTIFVFLLSTRVYGLGVGSVLGLLTLVPYLGLFVLVLINGKANAVLRGNGVRVGLFGASGFQLARLAAADRDATMRSA